MHHVHFFSPAGEVRESGSHENYSLGLDRGPEVVSKHNLKFDVLKFLGTEHT